MENNITASNLRSAYGGESQAYMRYRFWGDHAANEGFPKVAKLFEAIAYAEKVHAFNHFEVLEDVEGDFLVAAMAGFGVAGTSENLKNAIAGEKFEIEEMYPAFKAVAKLQKESGALKSFNWAYQAEKVHADLFSEAKEAVDEGNDVELEKVQVCSHCGHTHIGEAPDKCPICGAKAAAFVEF